MAKIFITGGNGQLGRACKRFFSKNHQVVSTDIQEMDITNSDSILKGIGDFKPDYIVNCAAYTAVDRAESEPDLAYRLNVVGPSKLAAAAVLFKARLIHISTDYVFDGNRQYPFPWTEDDEANPQTVYGRTKLDGERVVLNTFGCDAIVLRAAWLYSPTGHNFLKTMLRLAATSTDDSVHKIVNDQYGCPTSASELAKQILYIIESPNYLDRGVYHTVCSGSTSWYHFATRFLELMNIDTSTFKPCTTAEFPTPAKRPRNSVLSTEKLAAKNMYVMVDWETALKNYVIEHGPTVYKDVLASL